MDKPLASCVCVTYDRPHLLNETLYCFLHQDYDNKELIIVNDQVDIKLIYDDPRVMIYNLNERFSSLGEKRNYTRGLTRGDYIFTMDDDDIYYSKHISRLLMHHFENPDMDVVANANRYYTEWNEGIQLIRSWQTYVPFNGACITKEYWLNNLFPNDKSCGEDADFVRGAKVSFIHDETTTFHYRWGLDIHHISGMGSDGVESYGIVSARTPIGETRIIELKPAIPEKVKIYYE